MNNKGQQNPNVSPYPITKDSSPDQINNLFNLLFKNKANRQMRVLENATVEQLEPKEQQQQSTSVTGNSEIFLNKIVDGNTSSLYLYIRVDNDIYRTLLEKVERPQN